MSDNKNCKRPSHALKTWSAALYIRLSREDELKGESNSVTSQREILREYLRQHPEISEFDCYVDDGWTGTNFDRPNFSRMMSDIYSGNVNCVIVKDLSRFGRNYTKGGELITDVFVRLGVRFIACNNFYDSVSATASAATSCITLGVTNVINESVSATTSVNVRATLNVNRQQGKFIGSFAAYGYMKSPDDRHKLIVDEDAAPTVRLIFSRFINGESIMGIAKDLNEMGIPNPSMYKKLKGLNYKHPVGKSNDGLWPDSSVRRILQNEMYTGTMVQGKNRNVSYKDQRSVTVDRAEWYRVEGTHEPIIDKETFEKAQSLFNKHIRKPPKKKEVDIFAGLIRCAGCHRAMSKKTNNFDYGSYSYYRCVTNSRMGKTACSNHSIRIDKLKDAVLTYLQTMIKTAVRLDDILKEINSSPQRKKESSYIQKAITVHKTELEKCRNMLAELYPDWKNGIIGKDEYMMIKANLQNEIRLHEENINRLEKSAEQFSDGIGSNNAFIAHFKKFGNIDSLTRAVAVELIDEILVHEGNVIEINLKFRDEFRYAVEYIESNSENARTA